MSTTLNSGSLLQSGRYRIERVLGQGGFGITYLATHTGFDQKVALKEFYMKELCVRNEETSFVTLGTGESSATVERFRGKFLKEARNLFRLNHKHIVRVLDIFEENGTAYFAMEYAEGGSLSQKVKAEGALSESVATRYILQVAEALAYLHEQKMNHLDVKPANIMLSAKDDVVLIDFGLAKQYDATGGQTSTTPAGISEGYAPMEQYKLGGVAEFTPETDIYALGATFFKLLTGETPPSAQDVFEDGVPVETLRQHGVSEAAISVIEQAMKPSKKKRTNNVEAFMAALKKEKPIVVLPSRDNEETKVITIETAATKEATEAAEILDAIETVEVVEAIEAIEIDEVHDFVDFDLPSGTLWGTCNVGASAPEEYGDYFAWGEIDPKDDYTWAKYKWMAKGSANRFGCNKYSVPDTQTNGCWYEFSPTTRIHRFVGDDKKELSAQDDAANSNIGKDWCVPTKAQLNELRNECTWTWTIVNGTSGYLIESKHNGRKMFLPAAGNRTNRLRNNEGTWGYYWTRTLDINDSSCAHFLYFLKDNADVSTSERHVGFSIRPVRVK